MHPCQEERSDNEAVNELIGHFESDKQTADAPEEPSVAPSETPVRAEEDEVPIDEEPVKQEEGESPETHPEDEHPAEPEMEVEEGEEEPAPPSPEPLLSSRAEGRYFLIELSSSR